VFQSWAVAIFLPSIAVMGTSTARVNDKPRLMVMSFFA
jgi:hypothetical protein